MNALTPLAVQNLDLLRRLRQGNVESKTQIAAEMKRELGNFSKTVKRLTDEGLIDWPNLTEAGQRVLDAADMAEGKTVANPVRITVADIAGSSLSSNTPRVWTHADFAANPDQPRKRFDPEKIEQRADSMKIVGQLQNILARPNPDTDGPALQIVAGEGRWRSAGRLIERGDWPADHPINVDVRDLTDEQVDSIALIENIQRADLTYLEEARAFVRMQKKHGWSANRIAEEVSKEPRVVQLRMRLLRLSQADQDKLENDEITYTQAQRILDAMPKPLDLTPAQRLIVAEVIAAATPATTDATHWRGAETDRDTATAAIADAGLDKALFVTGPKFATGIYEVGFGNDWSFFERFKAEHPDLIKPDTRAAALLAIRATAAGADAAEGADTDGRQLTTWLNGPFALTEEGRAVVRDHEQAQRDSATAEATRMAEAQVRADRLATVQRDTDSLLCLMASRAPETNLPAEKIAALMDEIGSPLPWTYRVGHGPGDLFDRNGEAVGFDAWSQQAGAVRLQMIMAAMNAAVGAVPIVYEPPAGADDDVEDPETPGEFEEDEAEEPAP